MTRQRGGPTLIDHLVDDLSEPPEILTSLDRLAAAASREADDVRPVLAELAESADAQVYRGREAADVERLEAPQRFRLVLNWEHFHQIRMKLSIAGDAQYAGQGGNPGHW
ncbi:DUF6042 family protein [Streptomyces sp. NPDC018036]|uniref:DUF6042 family protein n=1 Tax=Streptomyces sp. NPDC018036 TaxID=3365035 RepID=UPI00378FA5FD